jgi:hypothetical protein
MKRRTRPSSAKRTNFIKPAQGSTPSRSTSREPTPPREIHWGIWVDFERFLLDIYGRVYLWLVIKWEAMALGLGKLWGSATRGIEDDDATEEVPLSQQGGGKTVRRRRRKDVVPGQ